MFNLNVKRPIEKFFSFTKARKYDDDYENAFLNKNPEDALQISEQVYGELVKLENRQVISLFSGYRAKPFVEIQG